MKKIILTLVAALACTLFFASCEKNNETVWVSYRVTVDGTVTNEAFAIQDLMNAELAVSLSGGTGSEVVLYPDTAENDAAAIAACDKIYAPVAHGAKEAFHVLLNKSYPSADPDKIKTVTLKKYEFSTK